MTRIESKHIAEKTSGKLAIIDFDIIRSNCTSSLDINFINRVENICEKIKTEKKIEVNSADYAFIAHQKFIYSTFPRWRQELLKQTKILNVITNKNAHTFNYKFSRAKEYYEKFGDLRVPVDYVDEKNFALGKWVANLRRIYCQSGKGFLDENRIQKLENIGMEWKINAKLTWNEWYGLAKKYYVEHGDLKIPCNFEIDGYKIGNWIVNQRSARNNPKSKRKITQEQIESLDNIGMIWNTRNRKNE